MKLNTGRLGTVSGFDRVPSKLGYCKVGIAGGSDSRETCAQNYHCLEKGLNLSLSIGKPGAGGVDDMACLACSPTHSLKDKLNSNLPVVVVLSDQCFPALLPAEGGGCMIIIRVEDGTLMEIESVFADRFKA